jgi:hypothetical protein
LYTRFVRAPGLDLVEYGSKSMTKDVKAYRDVTYRARRPGSAGLEPATH